ncbi:MAG: extracellular solute-binding protein [Clostridiales bacterium]|nr:extracellular solute-binding protein [Clostridiales bacterium]
MKKNRIVAVVLALTLLLVANAVPAFALTSETAGELTIWVRTEASGLVSTFGIWGNEPGDAYYDYLKEEFPNVKFNFVINKGWEELPAAAAAGEAPDIFFWEGDPQQVISEMTAQGLCEDLNPLIAADDTFVNNFVPALLTSHTVDGGLYGLPFDVMPYGIFVNYDVLDKANVPYPELNWTLDEFTEMCKAVTNKSDPYNTTIAIARNIDEEDYNRFINMFLAAYGVTGYGEKDGVKYSNLSENPDAITALEKYLELRANNYAYTLSAEERSVMGLDNSIWDIDWEASIAATFPGVSSWAFLTDENGDPRFTQVFYPAFTGPKGGGAVLNTISYSIYAGSENKDLAWEYLSALTSEAFRNNAHCKDVNDPETTIHVFVYDENTASFTFGLPPFTTEYTLNEDFAKLYDGLYAAMLSPVTIYVDAEHLVIATQKVARGEMQLVDALKEYDDFVNANNLVVYPD